MGTNYYWHKKDDCEFCGRPFNPVHIGKSSYGWTFTFHAVDEIRSWKDWKKALRSYGFIRDEYGEKIPLEEFEKLVESKKNAKMNHAVYMQKNGYGEHDFLDDEGNSFSDCEFS